MAVASGYRETGVSISALDSQQEKVLVAIRTTAIRMEVPLASYNEEISTVSPFGLTSSFLVSLIKIINCKFDENERRKQKLLQSLQQFFQKQCNQEVKETKQERWERMRAEGLKSKEVATRHHFPPSTETGEAPSEDEDMHLDQLTEV
jgi:tRNA(Phe) wybutosine-synthesizing methylase Tyw3